MRDKQDSAIFAAFQKSFTALLGEMSPERFAKQLGMSQATVKAYLVGAKFPDSVALSKISEVCDVSVDWLLGRSQFRSKENENITAKEMGLSEEAALSLQKAHNDNVDSENKLYPQLVSAIIENKHFTRFVMQIRFYMSRVEEVEEKLNSSDPSLRGFYSYSLKAEKLAVTEVLNDLLNDMVPLPDVLNQDAGGTPAK